MLTACLNQYGADLNLSSDELPLTGEPSKGGEAGIRGVSCILYLYISNISLQTFPCYPPPPSLSPPSLQKQQSFISAKLVPGCKQTGENRGARPPPPAQSDDAKSVTSNFEILNFRWRRLKGQW